MTRARWRRSTALTTRHQGWQRAGRAAVKSTIHWVSAPHAVDAEVRLYDLLFTVPNPGGETEEGMEWTDYLNPNSLEVLRECKLEPSLQGRRRGDRYQFERLGYFCVDEDSQPEKLVFNRTVQLRDAWAKIEKAQKQADPQKP